MAELGFDAENLYKDDAEVVEMGKKKDMEKTQILTERHKDALDLAFKLKQMHLLKQ